VGYPLLLKYHGRISVSSWWRGGGIGIYFQLQKPTNPWDGVACGGKPTTRHFFGFASSNI
jgi:hypothetical protein